MGHRSFFLGGEGLLMLISSFLCLNWRNLNDMKIVDGSFSVSLYLCFVPLHDCRNAGRFWPFSV